MADERKNNVFLENLAALAQLDNFQKYILGTKGNGQPRAVYDVVKDYTVTGKVKKKKNKSANVPTNKISFYTSVKSGKKKKKKKKNKKHWHIDG